MKALYLELFGWVGDYLLQQRFSIKPTTILQLQGKNNSYVKMLGYISWH
jgi:hypothetical protein